MPCRSAGTLRPATLIAPTWKNPMSGIGPPFSFSKIAGASGPWIWKR